MVAWVKAQRFESPHSSQGSADYIGEVETAGARIQRLWTALDAAMEGAPEKAALGNRRVAGLARDRPGVGPEHRRRGGADLPLWPERNSLWR